MSRTSGPGAPVAMATLRQGHGLPPGQRSVPGRWWRRGGRGRWRVPCCRACRGRPASRAGRRPAPVPAPGSLARRGGSRQSPAGARGACGAVAAAGGLDHELLGDRRRRSGPGTRPGRTRPRRFGRAAGTARTTARRAGRARTGTAGAVPSMVRGWRRAARSRAGTPERPSRGAGPARPRGPGLRPATTAAPALAGSRARSVRQGQRRRTGR